MSDSHVFTPDPAYPVAWIVYINGIEVPAISVSVTYGVWAIPEASITMVPDPILQRLGAEDRVSVQVFYCDYWNNPEKPEFCLMFDGEIVGWSYVNVKSGRAITFSCVDYIQIFTQLFFFFMSRVSDIAIGESGKQAGYLANGVTLAGFEALYPYSLFSTGITGEGSVGENGVLPYITRPIDFIYNAVKVLCGSTPNRSVPAGNFFAPWADRTGFARRFMSIPFLESSDNPGVFPILRAVRADQAMAAVGNLASSVGSSGSVWAMFQEIYKTLGMEIVMLPTAPAISSDYTSLEVRGAPSPVSNPLNPVVIASYFSKPEMLFGLPPACNVFFPSQIQNLSYEENYITQPTRMYFNDESWTTFLNAGANASAGFQTMVRDSLAVAYPEEVNDAARQEVTTRGVVNSKNLLVYPEEFFKGPVIDRRVMPRWFLFLQQAMGTQQNGAEPPADPEVSRDVAPGDADRNLYKLFAKHEYYKERFSRRSGAVTLAFNPYPIPGFPCAVFDRRETHVDVMAYITQVTQSMSSRGWETRVSFSYGRTFQEMFALMNRQFSMENEAIRAQETTVTNVVNTGNQANLPEQMEPVGAIATFPPEPLREIRDVVQNFVRAKAFYDSLLFRVSPPETAAIDAEVLNAAVDRTPDPTQTREITSSEEGAGPLLDRVPYPGTGPLVTAAESVSRPPVPTAQPAQVPLKSSVFNYSELMDFVDTSGNVDGIQLMGLDASGHNKALEVIAAVRNNTATEEQLLFLWNALGVDPIEQTNISGAGLDPSTEALINSFEVRIRTSTVQSNIDGTKMLQPKEQAQPLFNSYKAAMLYGSRPICTLDEYIKFLGGYADPEGRILPNDALANNDPRTFPAEYLSSIRTYIPGPPSNFSETNITNTALQSLPDGSTVATATPAQTSTGAPIILGIPRGFPENRDNWSDILRQYRYNVLVKLSPSR